MSLLKPKNVVSTITLPALFIVAENDSFIKPHHTEEIFERYAGPKKYRMTKGEHNSIRDSVII